MDWHEVVNDKIDDTYYLMTYCPLCGSGAAFSSSPSGKPLIFRVSGLLYDSNVLLYDLQTESLWSQLMSTAIAGKLSGSQLEMLPILQTSWANWKTSFPNSNVLSTSTGFERNYSLGAYLDYRKSPNLMFPVDTTNNRLDQKEYVYGIEKNGKARAYRIIELKQFDATFSDEIGDEILYFKYNAANEKLGVIDRSGKPYPAIKLYWFAWFAFHPETDVYSINKNR